MTHKESVPVVFALDVGKALELELFLLAVDWFLFRGSQECCVAIITGREGGREGGSGTYKYIFTTYRRERKRERDRQTERKRERERGREGERDNTNVCMCIYIYIDVLKMSYSYNNTLLITI